MRKPKRCSKCGYNYLVQVQLEGTPFDEKPPAQKCPKCGESA